ncbi:MAG: MFS transporter, partial [Solirubrobacteraceae bacterium]
MSAVAAASARGELGEGRPQRVNRRAMAVLSAGHMFTDVGQGSIPALLPFLLVRDHLSYASASALVLAATISSSVIQPLFGHISDRRSLPWLLPLGPLVGGLGIGLIGIMPSFGLTFAAVLVSGVGVAAFHPEGSRFAHYVSGERRSSGMSLFSVGGNIGFALGPAIMTPAVLTLGMHGTLVVIVPTALMAAVLARELPHLKQFRHAPSHHARAGQAPPQWGPFALLGLVIALRSFVYFGMVTFLPLYFVHVLHTGRGTGGVALTAMLVGGAAGTLAGGPLADRFGRKRVLIGSMAILPALIGAMLISGPALAIVFAALAGSATIATFAVTIVMGQEMLPARLGVASGVTIGLSIGLGGVGAPLLGVFADAEGLR